MSVSGNATNQEIQIAAATLVALADRLAAGGVEDAFVKNIRANGEYLHALADDGDDALFRTALHDVNRHLPGRKLA